MRFILLIILLAISCNSLVGQEHHLDIIIYENEKKQSKVLEFFLKVQDVIRGEIEEAVIAGGTTIYSNDALSIGFQASSKLLKHENVLHDVSKVSIMPDQVSRWAELKVKTKAAIGPSLSVPTALAGLNVGFNIKAGMEEEMTIITPTHIHYDDEDGIIDGVAEKIKQTYGSVRHLRIPLTVKRMFDKFGVGFEFARTGVKSFITNLNGSISHSLLSASANVYASVKGMIKKRIKFLDQNVVLFEIANVADVSAGSSASLSFGIDFFQTEYFGAGLKANLISSSIDRLEKNELVYRYIVDISRPQAREALELAWNGDLTALQDMAVFRDQEDAYQGVFVDYEKSMSLVQVAKRNQIGFNLDSTYFDFTLEKIKYRTIGYYSPFLLTNSSTELDSSEKTKNIFQEEENIEQFLYRREKKGNFLFDWIISDRQNVDISSEVKKASFVVEDEYYQNIDSVATFDVMKLTFNYRRQHKALGTDEAVDEGLVSLRHIFSPYRTELKAVVDGVIEQKCKKDVDLNIRGTFYESALEQILKYTSSDTWVMLARYLDIVPYAQLRYEQTRKDYVRDQRREISRLSDEIEESSGLKKQRLEKSQQEIRKKLMVISNFKRKYIPTWEQLLVAETRSDRMRLFRDLFQEYKKDELFVFTMLSMKLGGDFYKESDQQHYFKGAFINYKLSGHNCDYQFSQVGDLMYKMGDVIRGWQ